MFRIRPNWLWNAYWSFPSRPSRAILPWLSNRFALHHNLLPNSEFLRIRLSTHDSISNVPCFIVWLSPEWILKSINLWIKKRDTWRTKHGWIYEHRSMLICSVFDLILGLLCSNKGIGVSKAFIKCIDLESKLKQW